MRLASIRLGDRVVAALVEGERLLPLAMEAGGVKGLIERNDPGAIDRARRAASPGDWTDVSAAQFVPCVPDAGKIVCLGLNFRDHAAEGGHGIPDYPALFMRVSTSVVGHGEPLVRPRASDRFDYEAELMIVVGRRCRHATRESALDFVFGYGVFNDGSIRDYQRKSTQWTAGKNFDRTAAFGPWIVTGDEVPPGADGLGITCKVNGEILQNGNTADMIFSVVDAIVILSEIMTLEPGDVIAMGTPAGVGYARKPPVWLTPGDLCEVEIEGIGRLANRIEDEVGDVLSPVVIAVGQTWPDLDIEGRILAGPGVRLIDGRGLAATDPVWAEASGVLLGTGYKLDRERLRSLKAVRGVVRYGIGYDNVDVAAAEEIGIPVAIIRDYCLDEVAEHAIALSLALIRALPHWDRAVRLGQWRAGEKPRIRKLSSLAFGVVGFGLIGRTVAEKASGLFGRVLVHDPIATVSAAERETYTFLDTLDEMLAQADVLTVHVPLVDGTRALLDAAALGRMKPTAHVINVSRGGIVDEAALLEAVQSGRLAGAALDTFAKEPLPADHPLMAEPRILLSPHVAWLSEEAEVKLRERASAEMALLLAGEAPSSPVTCVTRRAF